MARELIDAIGEYLHAHVERDGHARAAAAFGVSRYTLWHFLERAQRASPATYLHHSPRVSTRRTQRQNSACTSAQRA